MTDRFAIVEDHLLERRLVGVWEMLRDDCPTVAEGYAHSLEGYFLEIETMLDVSAIGIVGVGTTRLMRRWTYDQAVFTMKYPMIGASRGSSASGCQNGVYW